MITYLLHTDKKGYALTYENIPLSSDTLSLHIEGAKGEGTLYLHGIACPVLAGICAIPANRIKEGSNPLSYVEGEQRFALDELQRCGNIAYVTPPKTGKLLRLCLTFSKNANTALEDIQMRLSAIERQIDGYPLFGNQ